MGALAGNGGAVAPADGGSGGGGGGGGGTGGRPECCLAVVARLDVFELFFELPLRALEFREFLFDVFVVVTES